MKIKTSISNLLWLQFCFFFEKNAIPEFGVSLRKRLRIRNVKQKVQGITF